MLETPLPSPSVFTATSAYSLAGVAGIAVIATTAAGTLLPKNAPWQDRVTFIWLVRTTTHPLSHPNHFFLDFADYDRDSVSVTMYDLR
jgi:hypothetical protein